METIIENAEELNTTVPSPEETVSEETLSTNITRLADETTEPSPVHANALKVPNDPKDTKDLTKPATQQPPAYMPLPNTETTSRPIFLSRIRPGFWDLPEISFG